jgi:hypothetical protein
MFDGVFEPAAPRRTPRPDIRELHAVVEIAGLLQLGVSPTRLEARAARSAIGGWLLTDPRLEAVTEQLGALLSACKGGEVSAVKDAAQHVAAAAEDAIRDGFDRDCMAAALRYWGAVTPGAPKINIVNEEN